jgi:hypothetical protein
VRRATLLALLPIGLSVGGPTPALRPFAQTPAPRIQDVRLLHAPGVPVLRIASSERDALLARRLGELAAVFDPRVFPRDSAAAPAAARDTIRLLIAPDEQTFRRESGGRFPDWGLAVAFPREARIVVRPPRLAGGDVQDPGQVLAHELVHVYLALYLGPHEPAAPRWFHEGLASLLANEWGWGERLDLAAALLARHPLPLESLERGFPAERQAAGLAYLESLTAVAALRDLSGEEGLAVFLSNLRQLGDFDAALRRTYGLTYGEFAERWEQSLAARYGWAAAAASSWTWWTPAAVLLVLLVAWRRWKYRAGLAEMRRREALQPDVPGEAPEPWAETSGEEWKGDDEADGPPWDPRRRP